MAHPDKDSGTEQKDRFMQNFVKSGTAAAVLGLSADRDLLETKTTKNMRKTLRDLSLGSLWGHCPLVVLKIFQFFHFHTGRPILITPEDQ